ncbi:MAG TPA: response regulator transcription factor [Anaerolineales bacterium]|nr:response regulator transcription factor [Anaerolineales bacterium]
MNEPVVLVVDDEKPLREFVRRNLEARHYQVVTASNGLEALAIFNTTKVDLVILDMMMPHLDGLETTRRIRELSETPIIILTALGEESDKVRAFDLGADDYLTKPFGVGELLGRIKAVLRRARWVEPSPSNEKISKGYFVVDLERQEVKLKEEALNLTPTEYNLLVYLIKNAGKTLSHRMILKKVWGTEYGDESEYLRVYIGRLRQKIESDVINPKHLLTEHGMGYRFEA